MISADDLDGDGDVDLYDFDSYAQCAAGPGVPVPGGCCWADLDGDGDADMRDFGTFMLVFTGSL